MFPSLTGEGLGVRLLSQFVALAEPEVGGCVAGHTPIATRTQAAAAHFRAVGQATPFELLGKEATAEDA